MRHYSMRAAPRAALVAVAGLALGGRGLAQPSPDTYISYTRGSFNIQAADGVGFGVLPVDLDLGPMDRSFAGSAHGIEYPVTTGTASGRLRTNGGSVSIQWASDFYTERSGPTNFSQAVYLHGRQARAELGLADFRIDGPAGTLQNGKMNFLITNFVDPFRSPASLPSTSSYVWSVTLTITQGAFTKAQQFVVDYPPNSAQPFFLPLPLQVTDLSLIVGEQFNVAIRIDSAVANVSQAALLYGGNHDGGRFVSIAGCTVSVGGVYPASDGGPLVMDLPEGYTLNSVQANIVNNVWLNSPVPAPGTPALLLGAGCVIPRRRR